MNLISFRNILIKQLEDIVIYPSNIPFLESGPLKCKYSDHIKYLSERELRAVNL